MKIQELLEAIPVDQTTKDRNGDYIAFDQTRKVWVTVPKAVGKSMINRGKLSNGQLTVKTNYPEFHPPAAQSQAQPTQKTPKGNNWVQRKGAEWQQSAVNQLKKTPSAVKRWMDQERQAHRSTGESFDG